MIRAYLGLGANLGDRLANLREVVRMLDEHPSCRVTACSSIYETDPVGPVDQPDFLNAVIAIETELEPEELLDLVHNIENRLGRVRTLKWGPRVIDIDILLYGQLEMQADGLTLPHPELMKRAFVLVPFAEIAPDVEISGIEARQAAAEINRTGIRLTNLSLSY